MTKFNLEFKLKVITEYLRGNGSTVLAKKYHIGRDATVLDWVHRFEQNGIASLEACSTNLDYSRQFKIEVLNWRKQHRASLPVTARHFNLSSPSTIWQWEKRFDKYGIEGLERKRGNPKTMSKHKDKRHQTPVQSEKPAEQDRIKQLERENQMLKIENSFLKKLNALAQKKSAQKKSQD